MSLNSSDHASDDASLALRVARAEAGADREAEAELCRRLAPRVRLYGLRHLRDEAAACDLMQQVMLMMIERLRADALRDPDQLTSFVFGICRMLVLDRRRSHARRARLLETYGHALLPPEAPSPQLDQERLTDCLQRLPERERTVLIMSFYDDTPADALARQLDMSPENVRVVRHRALKRLRQCFAGGTE